MADEEVVSSIDKLTKVNEKLAAFNEAESQKQSAAAKEEQLQRIDILKQEIAAGDGRTREIRALKVEMLGIEKSIQDDADNNAQILANSAAALGMTEEQFRLQQKAQVDADKTNANLEALGQQLMSAGIKPEDLMSIEAYAKASADSAEKQEEVARLALANQPSASAQEEIDNETSKRDGKMRGLLGKIASGIGGLKEQGMAKVKSAGKGVMAILKGTLIAGFALAMVAFLNSKYWEDTKKVIVEDIFPALMNFYENTLKPFAKGIINFFKNPSWGSFKKIFDVENKLGLVAGLAGITALLAPGLLFKGLSLGVKALKGAFNLAGKGLAKIKMPGFGGKGGAAAKGGAIAKGGAVAKGGGKGGGAGKGIANIGKGIGKGLGGILRGIAGGFMAFANPAVAIGAAAFAAAIVLVGGAVAGAAYLLGKAMPTLSDGFKSFEELDGVKLLQVGKGIAAIGAGMAAFGAGKAIEGIGGLVGSIGGFFGGKDKLTPLEQLKIFSETPINAVQATSNANALVSYSKAMAAAGGAEAAQGIGGFIGGITGGLVKFFGGDSPLEKLQKFGEMDINAAGVMNNSKAVTEYAKAMSVLSGDISGADLVNTERANQVNQAGVARSGGGGAPIVVDAKSTNVVNSNSTSSATFTNTSTRNPNLAVAALNYSY